MQTPEVKDNFKLRRTAVGLRKQVTVLVMSFLSVASFHAIGHAQNNQGSTMNSNAVITYKTVQVNGLKIFYREAGDPSKPTILLFHGFPSSSHMYRDLIPKLADQFHLVAPDYPGSGNSDYPSEAQFKPTFANLADVMTNFITTVGLKHFIIYMQDFGGPVGFRIVVKHSEWIDGFIIQNANAYLEGIGPDNLQGMKDHYGSLTPGQRAQVDQLISRNLAMFLYQTGVKHPEHLNPDAWNLDAWSLANPDGHRIQTELIINYYSNIEEYPKWQDYLKKHQPRILVVWGKNDQIFLPPGAEAYKRDVPKTEIHFYDTGHFALEEESTDIAKQIKEFYR
jgi:pimeloyl-ACP methyl ester carboxylesterase